MCRFCRQEFDRIEAHFEQVHGDPLKPNHNGEWGDVVRKYVNEYMRLPHARLEKAGKKIARDQTSARKTEAALAAVKEGFEEVWIDGERQWVKK